MSAPPFRLVAAFASSLFAAAAAPGQDAASTRRFDLVLRGRCATFFDNRREGD